MSDDAVTDPVASLDGVCSGRWWVTTAHGTRHLVDMDERTAIRCPPAGREFPGGFGYGPVTADGVPFRFSSIRDARIGGRMRLDNPAEWRITSAVVTIEPAEAESHSPDAHVGTPAQLEDSP